MSPISYHHYCPCFLPYFCFFIHTRDNSTWINKETVITSTTAIIIQPDQIINTIVYWFKVELQTKVFSSSSRLEMSWESVPFAFTLSVLFPCSRELGWFIIIDTGYKRSQGRQLLYMQSNNIMLLLKLITWLRQWERMICILLRRTRQNGGKWQR